MRSRAVLASLAMGCVPFIGCSDKSDGGGGAAGANNAGAPSAGSSGSGVAGASAGAGVGGAAAGAGGSIAGSIAGGAAGSSAGSSSGGAGAGACAGALICDDFESYTDKPMGPWTVRATQGAVKIDTERHVSGTKSVKLSTLGVENYQRAFIGLEGMPFPIAGNAFYGRMMFYATKAANDGVHWTMIQAEGAVPAQGITNAQVRYGGQQTKHLMANYDSSGKKSDCWNHSTTTLPEGKWACMQWYFDGKTNTQKFWLDSKPIEDLTVTGHGQGCIAHETQDTWFFPQDFAKAYVGWESYQKDDARDVWIDDVAIGNAPIACPAITP